MGNSKKMGKHKIKGIPGISVGDYYGGHTIYVGEYDTHLNSKIIWTQAGDDCEGNVHGHPAADIEINSKLIKLHTDDESAKTWKVPEYKHELKVIEEEIGKELEKFYSQYIRRPMFVKKKRPMFVKKK